MVLQIGQIGFGQGKPTIIKLKRPQVGTWEMNQAKVYGKLTNQKNNLWSTFNQVCEPKDRS